MNITHTFFNAGCIKEEENIKVLVIKMRGYMLVLATAFISGFSVFLNKFGVEASEPFVYTFVKNALVACLLLSIILLLGQRKALAGLQRRSCRNLAAIGILGGGIPFLLFFYGLKLTSAAKAAFIHKTMFVWVIPLAFLFLGERLSAKQTLAAAGLIAGSFPLWARLPLTTAAFSSSSQPSCGQARPCSQSTCSRRCRPRSSPSEGWR
jgi:uncharacterized membrane protein